MFSSVNKRLSLPSKYSQIGVVYRTSNYVNMSYLILICGPEFDLEFAEDFDLNSPFSFSYAPVGDFSATVLSF